MDTAKDMSRAVKAWLSDNGYTMIGIAEMFGTSQQAISNALNGSRFLGRNLATKWAEAFGFNKVYLMTGEGSLFDTDTIPSVPADDGQVLRGKVVPFFDAEAAAGNQYGMDMTAKSSAIALIEIGNVLNDSEMAVRMAV